MKRILVTGHLGFVGRHLLPALRERYPDAAIYGIDLKGTNLYRPRDDRENVQTYLGYDVRQYFKLRDDAAPFDLVVHLAAVVGGREKIEGAPLEVAVDLAIDADLFDWALRNRPKKVVYFSSSAAYPVALQGRTYPAALREDDIDLGDVRSPDLTYGWAKLSGEILASYARRAGLDVLVVRPFSGYAADQDLSYPFPSFVERAKRRADPFEIWGDGSQIRDFIHIDDVVAATLEAVDLGIDGPINLGTGRATSFLDLAALVTAAAGYAPGIALCVEKPVGVHTRYADATKMFSFYTPKISLEEAIERISFA